MRHRLARLTVGPAVAVALAVVVAVPLAARADGTASSARPDPRSCGRQPLFCETFDRVRPGPAQSTRWSVDTDDATATVVRTTVGAGPKRYRSRALHLSVQDNGRAFVVVKDPTLGAGAVYGRMRFAVAQFPTAPDWAHFTLVEATGTGSTEVVRPVGGQYAPTEGKSLWGVGADGGPTGDWTNWTTSAPTVAKTWQCVEWRLDPAGDVMQTWFDGAENPDLVATRSSHGGADVPFVLPRIDTMKIGWQLYQSGTTPAGFDVWIDDVALSRTRVGC